MKHLNKFNESNSPNLKKSEPHEVPKHKFTQENIEDMLLELLDNGYSVEYFTECFYGDNFTLYKTFYNERLILGYRIELIKEEAFYSDYGDRNYGSDKTYINQVFDNEISILTNNNDMIQKRIEDVKRIKSCYNKLVSTIGITEFEENYIIGGLSDISFRISESKE